MIIILSFVQTKDPQSDLLVLIKAWNTELAGNVFLCSLLLIYTCITGS